MNQSKKMRIALLLSTIGALIAVSILIFASVASAEEIVTDGPAPNDEPVYSHRFIVVLEKAPLSVQYKSLPGARSTDGNLNPRSAAAQDYVAQVRADQQDFISRMSTALPKAQVSTYIDETGQHVPLTYQTVLNAVVVDAGVDAGERELNVLRSLPGVKAVYRDYAHFPQLYTSTSLINADDVWPTLGGQADAGRGIKIASMDGGVHKDAPMFSGEGFDYPPGYPVGGLGLTTNNNGKIIASRVYFRSWDPPAPGDENPWPGVTGTSHGVHTAGIAAGNVVTDATYLGADLPTLSGVAPGAWVGSYRVFYWSVNGIQSFYTAEGIAALEDIVNDGMDVVNNSWGAGPSSIGGAADPLDAALINAVEAGVFVSMSNGNAGPALGTGDHPSPDYINVAASTTSGTYAAGRFNITAPEPVTDTLQGVSFSTASFGPTLPFGTIVTGTVRAAANVEPGNADGCSPFTDANAFDGAAAAISRGSCFFSDKVRNAQNAGAEFVVIYNNDGDGLITMACGDDCSDITISSIFIGETAGTALVDWDAQHGESDRYELDLVAFQAGNTPDVLANFSSRGPSARNSLKPDIAAPGVNIMSQGYDPVATGEARHLGFGQVSGTSMAAPHVSGAAALLLQKYPTWSPAQIKSALMSTAKYTDVYNADGTPAQPVDMGAGRLDVAAAMDPGVLLDPPAADFGVVISDTGEGPVSLEVMVTNVYTAQETYALSTLYTGDSFTQTTPVAGLSVSPSEVTLDPGETETVEITFDPAQGMGFDINQGYVVMDGSVHDAHMPFFARVVGGELIGDVLLVDVDFSGLLPGFPDYTSYYTETLENLGLSYFYWDTAAMCCGTRTLPNFATLHAFESVVIFTGDNFYPDGFFTVPTPLTEADMALLNEYAQSGGKIVVMGQGATSVLNESFFQQFTMGADQVQDSVTNGALPTEPVVGYTGGPEAFQELWLDLSGPNWDLGQVALLGANEVPPVDNADAISGTADFAFDNFTGELFFDIEINVSETFSITAAHIHTGTAGTNGGVLHSIFPFTETQVVTDSLSWGGSVVLSEEEQQARLDGALYVNVHTEANSGGEIRGQVPSDPVFGDGAGNQFFVDELDTISLDPDPDPSYQPLLEYPGPYNEEEGVVAIGHRAQPTLEYPELSYLGRSIFAAFGLEGVNNGVGSTSREGLATTFLFYLADEPSVTISHTQEVETSEVSLFTANLTSNAPGATGVSYRWDWGDGSDYTAPYSTPEALHRYSECGDYTVRVEVTDNYGNKAVGEETVTITACTSEPIYRLILPNIFNDE